MQYMHTSKRLTISDGRGNNEVVKHNTDYNIISHILSTILFEKFFQFYNQSL